MLVGALVDRRIDRGELLTRRQQEGADGRRAPDVLVLEQRLETVPALAEEHGILAAGLAPGDEVVARVGRRVEIPAIGLDGRGRTPASAKPAAASAAVAGDESASLQDSPPWRGPRLRGGEPAEEPGDWGDRTRDRYGKCGEFARIAARDTLCLNDKSNYNSEETMIRALPAAPPSAGAAALPGRHHPAERPPGPVGLEAHQAVKVVVPAAPGGTTDIVGPPARRPSPAGLGPDLRRRQQVGRRRRHRLGRGREVDARRPAPS